MKKLFMLLALVLGVVSCQNDPEGFGVVVGGEQDVNITVSLPESTRAGSEFGAFENGVLDTYDLRYILEIYLEDDNVNNDSYNFRAVKYSNATTVSFPVRLAPGRKYKFAVWADFVTKNNRAEDTDLFYETSNGLDEISILDGATMTEARDAFYGKAALTKDQSIADLPTIELTRPFAKVRVVATDIEDIRKFGIIPAVGAVEYGQVYTAFNAVEGDVVGSASSKDVTYNIAANTYTDQTGQLTVFADYILVPASGTVQFTLDVNAANGLIKSNSFNTAIPVEANKVTSIVGDVLTEGGNVSIKIDGTLGQKETINYVDTAESLQEIINRAEDNKPTTIILGGNVVINNTTTRAESQYGLIIPANKVIILDLNGFTISQSKECANSYSMIENRGTLTINDSSEANSGLISFKDTSAGDPTYHWGSYTISNYDGTLVVENGTIKHLGEQDAHMICAIWQYNGSTTINGGVISTPNYRSARLWSGDMTINGGVFEGQLWLQASDNNAKLTIDGGRFAPRGNDSSSVYVTNSGKKVQFAVTDGYFETKIGMSEPFGCITGGTFTTAAKENTAAALINDDYAWVEAENGLWNVVKAPIAQIGDVVFDTSIEDAVKAAKAGDTITLLKDITLTTGLTLPADVIFNGNGKQIKGSISAGGNLTFAGHTKIEQFSASYYNRTITIGEGACLEITGVGRVSLAYGNTFNINGSIENAKNADKANIQPSLIIPGGISITGGNNATMNVTNAYVVIGSTTSKNNAANGTFTLNFRNAIAEFTNQLTFSEPTGGMNPTFVTNIKDSVFTTGAKLCVAAANSTITVDNSTVTLGTYLRNSGTINLTNGSVLTGKTIQFGENGGNNGRINVDNSSLTIIGGSTGHAFDGQGKGSINATNGATVNVDYYKGMTVTADETSTITGTDIDGNKKIHYVSEEMKLEPTNPDALGGATIVSNVWDKTTGKGVITFDRDLTTIGDKAFQRLTNTTPSNWATSITLPASVTTIGDFAFYMCYSLKTVTIPESVRSIGQYAFGSCSDLVEINCQPTTPPTLGYGAFNNVSATCYVPTGSVDTYKANWSEYDGNIEGREF